MKDVPHQIAVAVRTVIMLVVNRLANALPLKGQNTGEISDRFQVYFVPAGYVFAIWGVIYLGMLAFTIFQALSSQRENPRLPRRGLVGGAGQPRQQPVDRFLRSPSMS